MHRFSNSSQMTLRGGRTRMWHMSVSLMFLSPFDVVVIYYRTDPRHPKTYVLHSEKGKKKKSDVFNASLLR